MKCVLLLIWLLGTGIVSTAQNFHYKYYTEKDGLSNMTVTNLLTDQEGFLWVATSSGLNRFDGNAFEIFHNNPSDTSSLADNTIQKLFIDAGNRLWIGTNAGISLYHPVFLLIAGYGALPVAVSCLYE